MKPIPPTKSEALSIAKRYKQHLLDAGYPVRRVFLHGSLAKGRPHSWSDIDIAVICDPFGTSRHDENVAIGRERWDLDLRIEAICLHPEDMENRYSTIVQEVKRHGIEV